MLHKAPSRSGQHAPDTAQLGVPDGTRRAWSSQVRWPCPVWQPYTVGVKRSPCWCLHLTSCTPGPRCFRTPLSMSPAPTDPPPHRCCALCLHRCRAIGTSFAVAAHRRTVQLHPPGTEPVVTRQLSRVAGSATLSERLQQGLGVRQGWGSAPADLVTHQPPWIASHTALPHRHPLCSAATFLHHDTVSEEECLWVWGAVNSYLTLATSGARELLRSAPLVIHQARLALDCQLCTYETHSHVPPCWSPTMFPPAIMDLQLVCCASPDWAEPAEQRRTAPWLFRMTDTHMRVCVCVPLCSHSQPSPVSWACVRLLRQRWAWPTCARRTRPRSTSWSRWVAPVTHSGYRRPVTSVGSIQVQAGGALTG